MESGLVLVLGRGYSRAAVLPFPLLAAPPPPLRINLSNAALRTHWRIEMETELETDWLPRHGSHTAAMPLI